MFYYVYQVTNKKNLKVYIGKRCHKFPDRDQYMGSGSQIKSAIKKYGKDNFEKIILKVFNTDNEAAAFESSLVTKEFVGSPNSYNMHEGGHGGFAHVNNNDAYLEAKRRGGRNSPIGKGVVYDSPTRFKKGDERTILNSSKGGKSRSKESLSKMATKMSGSGNQNFGKHWYNNGKKNFLLLDSEAKKNNLSRGRIAVNW